MKNSEFIQSYPIVEINLLKGETSIPLKAIIDTGSPYTFFSPDLVEQLPLSEEDKIGEIEIHGIVRKEGCSDIAPSYLVKAELAGRVLSIALVVYDFHPELGIVGHNVLSSFKLEIDWKEKAIKLE